MEQVFSEDKPFKGVGKLLVAIIFGIVCPIIMLICMPMNMFYSSLTQWFFKLPVLIGIGFGLNLFFSKVQVLEDDTKRWKYATGSRVLGLVVSVIALCNLITFWVLVHSLITGVAL